MARTFGENIMLMLIILIGLVLLGGFFYFYEKKGLTLSADEQSIVNGAVAQKQKALTDFTSGKEVILSEYENLKADVEKALGLQAKLPVSPIIASSPAPQTPVLRIAEVVASPVSAIAAVGMGMGPVPSVPQIIVPVVAPVAAVEAPLPTPPIPAVVPVMNL